MKDIIRYLFHGLIPIVNLNYKKGGIVYHGYSIFIITLLISFSEAGLRW